MMISCELKLELHRGKIYRLLDFQSTVAQQASNGRKIDDEQTHRVRTCRTFILTLVTAVLDSSTSSNPKVGECHKLPSS
ncbi:hypothetical protein TNCT_381941 [Trichonephila clavata]|uniref:Uncharacterized protein n=1 Tax=Trichonephila clavata TaxID=2740835 RepID=A0A8X6H215_TRICU|nr:hypothetical protein TNCT_381941 [Trichonephila clavata]